MTLFRALVVRSLTRRRLRSFLAVLAVALGVAAFLASAAVTSSIERTATAAVTAISGGADLGVEVEDAGVPAAWAQEIRGVPGVAAAAPLVLGWASAKGATLGRVLVVGVDPIAEMALHRHAEPEPVPSNPIAFATGAGALVTIPLAAELNAADGGVLGLASPEGQVRFAVAGTFAPRGAERTLGGRVVVLALAAAQRVLGRGALTDRIDVRLAPGADRDDAARRIVARLGADAPARLRVGSPRAVDPSVSDVLGSVEVALRIGAAVALLVGMFLIHHTVAIGVAERRREIGVLRALGATRGQVRRLFASEALLLGVVGSVLGVALGFGLGAGALRGFAGTITTAYFSGDPAPVELSWPLAAMGVAAGALVALAAAWFPAASAAAEPPSDAIRRGPEERTGRRILSPSRLALTLTCAAAAIVLTAAPHLLGRWTGYVAAWVALLAFLAASPAVIAISARALASVLPRFFGIPGRLAADELARNPGRAALPAAALALGLALVIETAGTMTTLADGTIAWMEQQIAGDIFVSSGRAVMGAGGGHTPLDASLAADVAAAPGVAHVVGVRFRTVAWRDTRILVWAFDIAPYRQVARITIEGGPRDEVLSAVERGGACLVSENLMRLHGVALDDVLELPGAHGNVALRVAGSFADYSWPRGAVIVDRSILAKEFDDRLVDEFSVKLAPGADPDAATRDIVARFGPERETVVTSARALRDAARSLLTSFFSLSYAQMAAALAVAFLGVVNALWISVVLRRRELGLLRAVGATRRQVTRSIVLEAAGLGLIGSVCGLVGGALVEWLAVHRILPADTGWTFPMHFPWTVAVATAVLGVATSALAALVPARGAAGFPLRDAVAGE